MTRRKNNVASAQVIYAYRKLTPLDTPRQVWMVGKTSMEKIERMERNCRGCSLEKEFLSNREVRKRTSLWLNYFFNI